MIFFRGAAVVVCAALTAGCSTQAKLNETNFAAGREMVIGSPAMFKRQMTECVTASRRDPKLVELHMLLTGADKDRASEIACERVTKAYRDGRFKYEHYALITSGSYPPEMVRIIQGR